MRADIEHRLANCRTLPSPPRICEQIIALARQPDLELADLARVIIRDPGLTARVLRIANSSFYARRRHVDNLRGALTVLGINAAISLALGFSLVRSLSEPNAERYTRFWSRSLLAAYAAEELSRHAAVGFSEQVFLAAMVQDIGVLAMDQALGEEYQRLCHWEDIGDHEMLVASERSTFGVDHAEVGVWLIERWNLPDSLRAAVARSHSFQPVEGDDPNAAFYNTVALSGYVADIWFAYDREASIEAVRRKAEEWLGLSAETVAKVLEAVSERIPEATELYDVPIADEASRSAILDEAAELLLLHNLRTAQEVTENLRRAERLETRARAIEEQARTDPLTGVFNRRHMDALLEKEFTTAREHGWPVSLLFIDLDHFKRVNDTYGHQAGDQVLVSVAGLLQSSARQGDTVARFGGEEFIILLPAAESADARCVAQRLLNQISSRDHAAGQDQALRVTASAGVSTYSDANPCEDVVTLIRQADRALYAAKANGRNRVVVYGDELLST